MRYTVLYMYIYVYILYSVFRLLYRECDYKKKYFTLAISTFLAGRVQ